jgi:hypothetical protein
MWNPDQVSEYMTRASVNPLARIVFIEHKIDGCVMFRMNVAEFAQFDARVEGIAESIQEAIDRLRPLDGLGAYNTCVLCTSVPLPTHTSTCRGPNDPRPGFATQTRRLALQHHPSQSRNNISVLQNHSCPALQHLVGLGQKLTAKLITPAPILGARGSQGAAGHTQSQCGQEWILPAQQAYDRTHASPHIRQSEPGLEGAEDPSHSTVMGR